MEQRLTVKMKGRKILVIDDDRLNLHILSSILQNEGFAITEANTGEQGLELYQETKPDLVLLDVVLPGIDGFATCRELRSRYGDDTAPVIFITALDDEATGLETKRLGAIACLRKPFSADLLIGALEWAIPVQPAD